MQRPLLFRTSAARQQIAPRRIAYKLEPDRPRPVPINFKAVNRIREIIEKRTKGGESLGGIKTNSCLNPMESRIVDIYVMPEKRILLAVAAKKLERSKETVSLRLRIIENKLNGIDPYEHLKRPYLRLSNGGLMEKIRETSALSRWELRNINSWLTVVAGERMVGNRSVLDVVLPIKASFKTAPDFRAALRKAANEKGMENVLAGLTPLETDIIQKRVNTKKPVPRAALASAHGLTSKEVLSCENKLLTLLRNRPAGGFLVKVKELADALGIGIVLQLKGTMDEQEALLLENRVLKDPPATLDEVGKMLHMTREGARLVQKRVYERLLLFRDSEK